MAIGAAGIATGNAIRTVIDGQRFQELSETWAAAQGGTPAELSHLVAAVIAIHVADSTVLPDYPELLGDPELRELLGYGAD